MRSTKLLWRLSPPAHVEEPTSKVGMTSLRRVGMVALCCLIGTGAIGWVRTQRSDLPPVFLSLQKEQFTPREKITAMLAFHNPTTHPVSIAVFDSLHWDGNIEFWSMQGDLVSIAPPKPPPVERLDLDDAAIFCPGPTIIELPADAVCKDTVDLRNFFRFPDEGTFRIAYRVKITFCVPKTFVLLPQRTFPWPIQRMIDRMFHPMEHRTYLHDVDPRVEETHAYFEATGEFPAFAIKKEHNGMNP